MNIDALKKELKSFSKQKLIEEYKDLYLAHDMLKQTSIALNKQLDQANEKLKCAIVPKFKIGQNVWSIINDKIGKANITKITAVKGSFNDENTINYSITDSYGYALRLPEEQLFSTIEEAQAKLQELRGGE